MEPIKVKLLSQSNGILLRKMMKFCFQVIFSSGSTPPGVTIYLSSLTEVYSDRYNSSITGLAQGQGLNFTFKMLLVQMLICLVWFVGNSLIKFVHR